MKKIYTGAILLLFFLSSLCRYRPHTIPSAPSSIHNIQGWASLRITGEQGTAKSKFSFVFQLPHKGRIEVINFLGQSVYQIILGQENSYLVIPAKKVYWEGNQGEVINKFFGVKMNLQEIFFLLSGRTTGEGNNWKEWEFSKDQEGRIKSGDKGNFRFRVEEYFPQSSWVKVLLFHNSLNEGRLKVLNLEFNQPLKGKLFSSVMLQQYQKKKWEEIQRIIQNES